MKKIALCVMMGFCLALACKPKAQSNRHTTLLEKENLTDAEIQELEREVAALENEMFNLARQDEIYSSAEQRVESGQWAAFEEAAGRAGYGGGSEGGGCSKICELHKASKAHDKQKVKQLSYELNVEVKSKKQNCLSKIKRFKEKIFKCKNKDKPVPYDNSDDKDTAYPNGGGPIVPPPAPGKGKG